MIVSINDCSMKELELFESGNEDLDRFLKQYASQNDRRNLGKTFVLLEQKVVGYYTLSNAQIEFDECDSTIRKSLPRYPIPCIRLARLAVDKTEQHKKYGSVLLKDAFIKIVKIALTTGIYFVIVDAKEDAVGFYEHYGFVRISPEKQTLVLPVKSIQKAITLSIS